jgi:xanthine dehydrogenase molybdenum-binding subunit
MADTTNKLIGQNYTTPDLVAKVTGKARYAEDWKADGMLFTKLLLSPMPHARVTRLDTSAALAMPGVKAILTADDLPGSQAGATLGENVVSTAQGERPLTMEPVYEGEPILAVAAVDEVTAAEAIEKIVIEFEPLPFNVDVVNGLRPGSPNARLQGNTWMRPAAPAAPAAGAGRAANAPAAGAAAAGAAAAAAPAAPAAPAAGAAAAAGQAPAAPGAAAGAAPAGQGRRGAGAGAGAGAAAGAGAQAAAGQAPGRGEGRGRGAGRGGPGGPGGAAPPQPQISELKWTEEDFAAAKDGQLPTGKATDEWTFGDVDAVMKTADLVIDETFVTQSTGHQPLETRSAMAYWQNGKLYIHCSTQSTVQTVAAVARGVGIAPAEAQDKIVLISEYTGGGFGSKIPGSYNMAIPALLAKKANAPVQLRISREEEHYIGRARPGVHARVKIGLRKDGKILAIDGFALGENGPYDSQGDAASAGRTISLCYQPTAMRWRSMNVLTNTPPKVSQRAPGGMQGNGLFEPMLTKAANQLGVDQVQIRKINAPAGKAKFGPGVPPRNQQAYVTSCFLNEALDKGAELFNWEEKKARSGKRTGSKVRGAGVAISAFSGGSTGFDGMFIIRPDGKVQFQSGIGNHGTHSAFDVHRVAAEMIGVPWEQCEVVFGNTSKNLPWTCISAGSQTAHAMTRAAHAAATDAITKLQEIAAKSLGGSPESYKVANGRVSNGGRSMTLAQAAQKAIELGGKYDGHELPNDVNNFTKKSAAGLVGLGLMGVGRDAYPRDGQTQSYFAGFAEVEVDLETGKFAILEYTAIADVGTVLNPRGLKGQSFGGSMLGIGHAISQKWVYDQHYGVPLAKRFHYNKPPTILDAPQQFKFDAVNLPDPETPVGVRGVGEPPVGAAYGAVMNAIQAAIGDEAFRRSPVTPDMILMALEHGGKRQHEPLTTAI